jgi:hypothetical protein
MGTQFQAGRNNDFSSQGTPTALGAFVGIIGETAEDPKLISAVCALHVQVPSCLGGCEGSSKKKNSSLN